MISLYNIKAYNQIDSLHFNNFAEFDIKRVEFICQHDAGVILILSVHRDIFPPAQALIYHQEILLWSAALLSTLDHLESRLPSINIWFCMVFPLQVVSMISSDETQRFIANSRLDLLGAVFNNEAVFHYFSPKSGCLCYWSFGGSRGAYNSWAPLSNAVWNWKSLHWTSIFFNLRRAQ
jgi:hypothetical protein